MSLSDSRNSKHLGIIGGFDGHASPAMQVQAKEMAFAMARDGIGLACMANAGDLITQIAETVKKQGGYVTCILTQLIPHNEHLLCLADEKISSLHLHESKMHLYNLSAGLIVLPGDIETLDILSEYLTWMQRVHQSSKPVYLVNERDYWEPLLQLFERMQSESFLPSNFHSRYKLIAGLRDIFMTFDSLNYNE